MFFDRYCELCADKGLSPTKAAVNMGISRSAVSAWKKGDRTPQGESLAKIADYFDVTVDYLLEKTDQKEKASAQKSEGITDEDLKFALFDAPEEITDDIMDEVKRFAKYVEEQKRNGHIK